MENWGGGIFPYFKIGGLMFYFDKIYMFILYLLVFKPSAQSKVNRELGWGNFSLF